MLFWYGAEFSHDRIYRYKLWRKWGPGNSVVFIGLNPSTADERLDDPTIRRCVGFARQWGYSGITMLNIFSVRATNPKDMEKFADPVGPENDRVIFDETKNAPLIIAAWGTRGGQRGKMVATTLLKDRVLSCLGKTIGGDPKHPLYLRADTKIQIFNI